MGSPPASMGETRRHHQADLLARPTPKQTRSGRGSRRSDTQSKAWSSGSGCRTRLLPRLRQAIRGSRLGRGRHSTATTTLSALPTTSRRGLPMSWSHGILNCSPSFNASSGENSDEQIAVCQRQARRRVAARQATTPQATQAVRVRPSVRWSVEGALAEGAELRLLRRIATNGNGAHHQRRHGKKSQRLLHRLCLSPLPPRARPRHRKERHGAQARREP